MLIIEQAPNGYCDLPTTAAKSGAAARLAKIERASAHATCDLGQREKLVPLPELRSEVLFCGLSTHNLIIGCVRLTARLIGVTEMASLAISPKNLREFFVTFFFKNELDGPSVRRSQ